MIIRFALLMLLISAGFANAQQQRVFYLGSGDRGDQDALQEYWYASIYSGYNKLEDNDSEIPSTYGADFLTGINTGYDFGRFRLEGEFTWRVSDVNLVHDSPGHFAFYRLGIESIDNKHFGINAYWDMTEWRLERNYFTPYVGVGIGLQMYSFEASTQRGLSPQQFFPELPENEITFAYQGMIGIDYQYRVRNNPNFAWLRPLHFYGEYRYTQSGDLDTPNDVFFGDTLEQRFSGATTNHAFVGGIKIEF